MKISSYDISEAKLKVKSLSPLKSLQKL